MAMPTHRQVFSVKDLFPSLPPEAIDPKLIEILRMCCRIGVPFPAEVNRSYSSWWHSLHEVAHWAVKPMWYVELAAYLIQDITIEHGSVFIPRGKIPGVGEVSIPVASLYRAGNDVIPEIGLYRDPTPGEREVRVWSLMIIEHMGWPHPFDDNTQSVFSGNEHLHKPASARVWAPPQMRNPDVLGCMKLWDIDPMRGKFRARAAPSSDAFALPHPRPATHAEMMENIQVIHDQCGRHIRVCPEERLYWRSYLKRRWPDLALARLALES